MYIYIIQLQICFFYVRRRLGVMVTVVATGYVTRVQILDQAIYISDSVNKPVKYRNLTFLPPFIGIQEGILGSLTMVRLLVQKESS